MLRPTELNTFALTNTVYRDTLRRAIGGNTIAVWETTVALLYGLVITNKSNRFSSGYFAGSVYKIKLMSLTSMPRHLTFTNTTVAAECKLLLSTASRANAKSLHALWPIRTPTSRLRQSGRVSCPHA